MGRVARPELSVEREEDQQHNKGEENALRERKGYGDAESEHAAGAAAKGAFATSRRLGNVKSSKVRQVDLEE
jgi:hypothetical protein